VIIAPEDNWNFFRMWNAWARNREESKAENYRRFVNYDDGSHEMSLEHML